MKGKIFTLDEARRTLPLVRQITGDVVSIEHARLAKAERYKALYALDEPNHVSVGEMAELEASIADMRSQLLVHVRELQEIGCFVKSTLDGLVDWYGEVDGQIVYWCWRHGEPDIEHYHDLESGFLGRMKLPAELAAAGSKPDRLADASRCDPRA